jgi:hypothetical protein
MSASIKVAVFLIVASCRFLEVHQSSEVPSAYISTLLLFVSGGNRIS